MYRLNLNLTEIKLQLTGRCADGRFHVLACLNVALYVQVRGKQTGGIRPQDVDIYFQIIRVHKDREHLGLRVSNNNYFN